MLNQDKLNSLTAEFQQWRSTRQYAREKTPQQLKNKTVELAQDYSSSQISTALNIARSTFHYWCKQATSHNKPVEFIAIPEAPQIASEPLNIRITCKNGHSLQLTGAISAELLTVITKELLA
jgi:transposase-like protein